jgi:(1->4)-alpha-D-glucan 1-alpha-D-glucosylmutase
MDGAVRTSSTVDKAPCATTPQPTVTSPTAGRRPGAPLRATYRVQLHAGFTFDDAAAIAGYLAALGVSHLYTSPILQAAPGSTHGYDVVDHRRINAELGGEAGYERLLAALHAHGLGHVLDIVPNHMAIAGRANAWWWDVLENGPASRHAHAFDIDWAAGDAHSAARVLVPVLADQIGRVLEAGELAIERHGGSFTVRYFDHELPVSPRTLDDLLTAAAATAGSDELASVATAFGHLPHATNTDPASVAERHRDKELLRERLAALIERDATVAAAVDAQLAVVNADPDALDIMLLRQNYRLASWRTASEELDYRRFFNIETLVGLRVEDPDVFAASHELIAELVSRGAVEELRVDHIDGLRDPAEYLARLRDLTGGVPVVVEKILEGDEELPPWPVAGTTGYEFAKRVDGLFVDADAEPAVTASYTAFVGDHRSYDELVAEAKQQIMRDELRAEVERLTGMLAAVCQHHRRHRDHTRHELREALRATLAAFTVYRTYVRPGQATSAVDRAHVGDATKRVAAARPDIDGELLAFLTALLAGEVDGRDELELAVRFQQVSTPVMAKGVEDTAFYRYQRLISLNEVGGDPGTFGTAVADFHQANERAAARHPRGMLTLSTHDTKRSNDVRARHRQAAGPGPATELLLYETLVGAWPITAGRFVAFARKATKEAKVRTSWTSPDPVYDEAVRAFVEGVLADGAVVAAVERFLAEHRIVERGRVNSLAQTALLLTGPGVPDVYQGTEAWDLSLVDPDNRRPVDYEAHRRALGATTAADALAQADSGAPKLWLIRQVLADRRQRPDAYDGAPYVPVIAHGPKARHAVAYQRRDTLVVVPRLVVGLGDDWDGTTIEVPDGDWRDVITGAVIAGGTAQIAALLAPFPVAVLARSR